jgi:hypothetical protein
MTGMMNVPQAPRTMKQTLVQLRKDKETKLYPRLALFEALSVFKDKQEARKDSKDPVCETRRDFLDSFAYLCDIQKGGKTVTAAALQKLPMSNFLWLAANEGVSDGTYRYARDVLERSKSATLENHSIVKADVFKLAVEQCGQRIQYYKGEVQTLAKNCRMALRSREKDDLGVIWM